MLDQMVRVEDAAATIMLSDRSAVFAGLLTSVARTVKLEVPAVVGVPVIAPVLGLRVRPAGRGPLRIDHVYGEVPPLAASVAE